MGQETGGVREKIWLRVYGEKWGKDRNAKTIGRMLPMERGQQASIIGERSKGRFASKTNDLTDQ